MVLKLNSKDEEVHQQYDVTKEVPMKLVHKPDLNQSQLELNKDFNQSQLEESKDSSQSDASQSRATTSSDSMNGRSRVVRKLTTIIDVLKNVSVEPTIVMFFMVTSLQENIIPALVLARLKGNSSRTGCNVSMALFYDETQVAAAEWSMKMLAITTIPTIALVTLLGAWSDRHTRKPAIILPIIGYLINSLYFLLDELFIHSSVNNLLYSFIPIGLTGNTMTFFMAVACYITDSSSVQYRMVRIAILELAKTFGLFMGQIIQGQLHNKAGFVYVFMFSFLLSISALLYTVLVVKDVSPPSRNSCNYNNTSALTKLKDFFDLRSIVESFRTCFLKGKLHNRLMVWMLIVCLSLTYFVVSGETNIGYYYINKQFCFDALKYSYLKACMAAGGSFGLAVVVPILSRYVGIRDEHMGIISFANVSLRPLMIGLARVEWLLYVANASCWMYETTGASVRSVISKIVPNDDIGKVFSAAAIVDAIAPSVAGLVYPAVYKATLNATCFFISFGVLILGVPLMTIIWLINRRYNP